MRARSTCADIDFNRSIIHVRDSKNHKDRFTILGEKTAHLLESNTNLFYIMLSIVSPLDSSSISVDRGLDCEDGQYLLPLAS